MLLGGWGVDGSVMGENEKTRKEVRIWTGCDRARKTEWVMATWEGAQGGGETTTRTAGSCVVRFLFFNV